MAPLGSYDCTEDQNAQYLVDELKLVFIGQYFAESFIRRAATYGVELPRAFVFHDCLKASVTAH